MRQDMVAALQCRDYWARSGERPVGQEHRGEADGWSEGAAAADDGGLCLGPLAMRSEICWQVPGVFGPADESFVWVWHLIVGPSVYRAAYCAVRVRR